MTTPIETHITNPGPPGSPAAAPDALTVALAKIAATTLTTELPADKELGTIIKTNLTADRREAMTSLSPALKGLLAGDLKRLAAQQREGLRQQIPAATSEAYGYTADVEGLPSPDDLAEGDIANTQHPLHGYLRYQFIESTLWYRDGVAGFVGFLTTELGTMIATASDLQKLIDAQIDRATVEHKKAIGLAADLRTWCGNLNTASYMDLLGSQPKSSMLVTIEWLRTQLTPLAQHLTAIAASAAELLGVSPDEAVSALLDTASPSGQGTDLTLATLTKERVMDLTYPVTHSYDLLCDELHNAGTSIRPAALGPAIATVTSAEQRHQFAALVSANGVAAWYALARLPADDTTKIFGYLARGDLQLLLKGVAPPGTSGPTLLRWLTTIASATDSAAAIGALETLGQLKIGLPEGTKAIGWVPVNGLLIPGALDCGSVSTDQACLKHVAEELGTTPNRQILEAYFAELARACRSAAEQWRKASPAKRTNFVQVTMPIGSWRFLLKMDGKRPLIFHIDSGYQRSGWATKR